MGVVTIRMELLADTCANAAPLYIWDALKSWCPVFALLDTKRENETSDGRFNYKVHRIDFTYLQLRSHDFSRTQITSSGHFRGSG